jgi:hypothetical protein
MITVFPVGALSTFPVIVFLSSTPSSQLNALGDDISAISVINEEMYVIGSCHVIENYHPITLSGLIKPVDPVLTVFGEFQQKFLLVASMCDVPHMTGYVVSVRSWHDPRISHFNKSIFIAKWAL